MKKNKKKLGIFLLFPVLILIFLKLNIFSVKQVIINMQNINCVTEQQVKNEIGIVGKNILFLDEKKLVQKIKQKFICVKEIKSERQLPSTVKINLENRSALARIVSLNKTMDTLLSNFEASPSTSTAFLDWSFGNTQGGLYFLVDGEGVVFAQEDKPQLPIVYYPGSEVKVGSIFNKKDFVAVAEVFKKLPQGKYSISGIDDPNELSFIKASISDGSLQIKRPTFDSGEQRLIFSLEKDIFRQLASLQLILQKAKIDGKVLESIDLRFDKPVVIYAHGKR